MSIEIIEGDCRVVLKELADQSIDLTVTSPPYDDLRSYGGAASSWGEDAWKDILGQLYRLTKNGGVVVWIVGDATVNGGETGSSFRQALFAMECGFRLHDTMIWEKSTFSAVGALSTRYAPVFEYMFAFSKGPLRVFNPIKDKPNIHAGTPHHGTVRQRDGSTKAVVGKKTGKTVAKYGQRHNVWRINEEKSLNKLHPAVFPEALAYDHIISWSNEGDTVLDPFLGSGTTAVAARRANRNFVGIEMNPEYYDIAAKRLWPEEVMQAAE